VSKILETFESIPQERWDAIFGTPAEVASKRRAAAEATASHKRARKYEAQAPAVLDDRLYVGWDRGLGVRTEGRAHRRQVMAEKGLVECG
jgi:hypothetical protein